jgi:hypothetical protein
MLTRIILTMVLLGNGAAMWAAPLVAISLGLRSESPDSS